MHSHYCDVEGHYRTCSGGCECICGLPMEGNDHSDCPVELRPCPEYQPEADRRMQEAKRKAVASLDNVTITSQLAKWKEEADERKKLEQKKR